MNKRLPLIVSSIALVLALLGSTPLGQAAESALEQVVPRAKRADFAANAGKLNGHKSAVNPKRGQIPVVGANGKLAASIGAVGPKGVPARKARRAGPGVSGYLRVSENINVPDAQRHAGLRRQLPRRQVRARRRLQVQRTDVDALMVFESRAGNDSTWRFRVSNETERRQADDPVRGLRERRLVGGGQRSSGSRRRPLLDRRRAPASRRRSSPSSARARTSAIGRTRSRGSSGVSPRAAASSRRSSPRAAGTRTPTSTCCACRSTWTRSSARASSIASCTRCSTRTTRPPRCTAVRPPAGGAAASAEGAAARPDDELRRLARARVHGQRASPSTSSGTRRSGGRYTAVSSTVSGRRRRHIERPNEYTGLAPRRAAGDPEAPRGDRPRGRERDSYVITEDSYIDYLVGDDVGAQIPFLLMERMEESHFLFLGYSMHDWNLRVILSRIWGAHNST